MCSSDLSRGLEPTVELAELMPPAPLRGLAFDASTKPSDLLEITCRAVYDPRRDDAAFRRNLGNDEAQRRVGFDQLRKQYPPRREIDSLQIEITGGQEDGPVQFDAVVEIRPSVSAAGYDGLRVEIPNPVASAEEIDEQIDNLRRNFAELSAVERAAADEDHVTIDIEATHGDEPVPGLTTTD